MKIYQIVLTNREIEAARRGDKAALDKQDSARDAMFGKAANPHHYRHTLSVDTDNLEEAFRLLNVWDNIDRIQQHDRWHSLSVGDIVENSSGEFYRCAAFGWDRLSEFDVFNFEHAQDFQQRKNS